MHSVNSLVSVLEHLTGIEPAYLAWEASVLPLNYRCTAHIIGEI